MVQHKIKSLFKLALTAILGYSDPFTVRIYQYLQKKNIRIPEDISILTIGGQIGCDYLRPPLSAMEYNDQYIGETAVRTMLEMIHEKRRVTFMVTPHQLKIRESSKKRKH